jgi:hypothetical protein
MYIRGDHSTCTRYEYVPGKLSTRRGTPSGLVETLLRSSKGHIHVIHQVLDSWRSTPTPTRHDVDSFD